MADDFHLYQNYPNPFNPSTKITFSIPSNSHVELTVYSIAGQEVAKLINEEMNIGKYSVDFNASNLSSGVYFYKLQAGKSIQMNKMILIK